MSSPAHPTLKLVPCDDLPERPVDPDWPEIEIAFRREDKHYRVRLIDAGRVSVVDVPPWRLRPPKVRFSELGDRLLLDSLRGDLYAMDLRTREVTVLLSRLGKLTSFCETASGLIVAACSRRIHVYDGAAPPESPAWYRWFRAAKVRFVGSCCGGRAVVIGQKAGRRYPTAVLGIGERGIGERGIGARGGAAGRPIRLLARLPGAVTDLYEAEGRVLDAGGLELLGVQDAWRAAFERSGVGEVAPIDLRRDRPAP